MIRWDKERYPKISEGLLQLAVANYVQWWRNYVVPNLCLFHEMDVAVLTRAGCLWEFEIKVSQRDWETDNRKDVKPAWVLDRAEELRAQGETAVRDEADREAPRGDPAIGISSVLGSRHADAECRRARRSDRARESDL